MVLKQTPWQPERSTHLKTVLRQAENWVVQSR